MDPVIIDVNAEMIHGFNAYRITPQEYGGNIYFVGRRKDSPSILNTYRGHELISIWKSTDGGATWNIIVEGPSNPVPYWGWVDNSWYCTSGDRVGSKLYISYTDNASTYYGDNNSPVVIKIFDMATDSYTATIDVTGAPRGFDVARGFFNDSFHAMFPIVRADGSIVMFHGMHVIGGGAEIEDSCSAAFSVYSGGSWSSSTIIRTGSIVWTPPDPTDPTSVGYWSPSVVEMPETACIDSVGNIHVVVVETEYHQPDTGHNNTRMFHYVVKPDNTLIRGELITEALAVDSDTVFTANQITAYFQSGTEKLILVSNIYEQYISKLDSLTSVTWSNSMFVPWTSVNTSVIFSGFIYPIATGFDVWTGERIFFDPFYGNALISQHLAWDGTFTDRIVREEGDSASNWYVTPDDRLHVTNPSTDVYDATWMGGGWIDNIVGGTFDNYLVSFNRFGPAVITVPTKGWIVREV